MTEISIGGSVVGSGSPAYIIAELSANHHRSLETALSLIEEAKHCGADAVKIQTYTPDTITIDCDSEPFQIGSGTLWEGKNLYELYGEAFTPGNGTANSSPAPEKIGIPLFSSPFDHTAVDYLEQFEPPAYKIASFELVDLPLIRKVASTGRAIILSTGMGSLCEIAEAVEAAQEAGCTDLALLKCTSAYPAPPEEANLRRIPHMAETFKVRRVSAITPWAVRCRLQQWPWAPESSRSTLPCLVMSWARTAPSLWSPPSSNPWSRRCALLKRRSAKSPTS